MGDDGFDFHRPQRRESKRFEPPPWEQEAFEELQKKRAENSAEPSVEQPVPASEPVEVVQREEVAMPIPVPPPVTKAPETEPAKVVPDAKVLEMLALLAEEEPRETGALWKVAIAAALMLFCLGVVMVIWGMAAIVGSRSSGATGVTGGSILLMFGAGFIGAAAWLVVRTLRQRGVL